MKRIAFLILAFVFLGSIPATAFGEDVFAPVKKVYLNDGKVIECQMGWVDGNKMICRKFGGNMTLPLQSINFEKTFPKYKIAEGEAVLLVHPGPRYQDENIVISNVQMVRRPEGQAMSPSSVVFDIMNRGVPCEVRVALNALDAQGRVLHQIDVLSESRLETGESSLLRKQLDGPLTALENQMFSLKVTQVERSSIQETPLNGKSEEHGTAGGKQDRDRTEKIRVLTETFLKERPSSR